MMFEYITHYYYTVPFRSLSALSRSEAMKVMEELCDDSPIFERFKEPVQYWENRLEAENWLRNGFKEKGGVPKDKYPFYAVLGTADWIENYTLSEGLDVKLLRIPLSLFSDKDVSFTLPDSMVSFWIGRDKPEEYYNSKYHGQIFTLSEVKTMMTTDLMNKFQLLIPKGTIPYIEAQIWNHEIAMNYYKSQISNSNQR
ncbi:hypothetical protein D7Z26_00015 [Cohnella endophytica]|uniref:DUF3841 domain-containing protein n=2 Tax=Cohnella endophytica TaxID=2419778 RepID=A0A494Y8M8_9BACL|nr:hypothetical protein D7Z26_00015 [Cohnella endophytica]